METFGKLFGSLLAFVGVGAFLPFQTRYWINGHSFIAGEIQRRGVRFHKDDNVFLWVSEPKSPAEPPRID